METKEQPKFPCLKTGKLISSDTCFHCEYLMGIAGDCIICEYEKGED